MTIKFEYKSKCCGHEYVEQRAKDESMFFPNCNKCGKSEYELINETIIANEVERGVDLTPAP
jgi:hypothetical protein